MQKNITPDNEIMENLNKELAERFAPKKEQCELLGLSYQRLGFIERGHWVYYCGSLLEFTKGEEKFKLHNANFCKDRLCPMCSWRRSYKIFAQVSKIMDVIESDYEFLFLTLTVKNVPGEELKDTIDDLQKAWKNLVNYKQVKTTVKGFFRALEITHDTEQYITPWMYKKAKKYYISRGLRVGDKNPNFDMYHPHFHAILAVNKSYFTSRDYLKQAEWTELWKQALNVDYKPMVDIRKCKAKEKIIDGEKAVKSLKSAVAEAAKYTVKSNDYLVEKDEDLTDRTVLTLMEGLRARRLVAFGGVFEKTRRALNLDDPVEGDLIHADKDTVREDVALMIYRYQWWCGIYKLIEVEEQKPKKNIILECDDEC